MLFSLVQQLKVKLFQTESSSRVFQAYSGHSGSCSQLRVIFSFYASTIVPALDAVDKVSDTIISKLLPYIQKVTDRVCSIMIMMLSLCLSELLNPLQSDV